ncbi:chaperonin-like RBCX protein 1, chloroplastic [Sorghum bicolor]|uniref:Chaperonin-like RbcX protein n=1 Tax=Sorghum bicolor TaxID=4558 RepID=C5YL11_SORBI|nr:chaperonin-like RBCX protein 1, chloroplastic [Sorghum bicolor]EES13856.1 hypothetical protein SORBI_3007G131200 [Sorghum bicolor]|eukprot:XP_002444361.1 chaperonin-like RBCX protein 1, chloroplastic [Sorghum bicolor]
MECSSAVVLPLQGAGVGRVLHLPVLTQPFWRRRTTENRRRLASSVAPARCSKMYVPGFGEGSPERKAAIILQHFFNYIAVTVVLAQLESYNREAYFELKEFISRTSLNDAEIFCEKLMRESPRLKGLAMRILEVRSGYVKNDFEWDNLKKLSFKMVDEANTKLMRDYVVEVSHIEDENYNNT